MPRGRRYFRFPVLFLSAWTLAAESPVVASGSPAALTVKVDSVTLPVAARALPPSWDAANPQMILAPLPAGGSYVAWNGADSALHVTSLSDQNAPIGADAVYPKTTLGGFTLSPGGYGYTAVRDSTLSVVRISNGGQAFRTLLIGDKPKTDSLAKFDPMHFGSSRLLFANGRFCSYFAHQMNWGTTTGVHQGDMLVFVDSLGGKMAGGWTWGTSHSLDERLLWDGQAFVTASIGDAYPKGMTFQRVGVMANKVTVMPVYGDMLGKANALFGNLVHLGPGLYALAFGSPEGRNGSWDAGVLFINAAGTVLRTVWLTAFPSTDDKGVSQVNAAKFGATLLVAWSQRDTSDRKDSTFLAVLDTSGQIPVGREYSPEGFGRGDDFVNYPNGDMGWAYARGGKMRIVRVPVVPVLPLNPGKAPGVSAGKTGKTVDALGRKVWPRRVRAAAKIAAFRP